MVVVVVVVVVVVKDQGPHQPNTRLLRVWRIKAAVAAL
jgi:hypothetical protein